MAASNLSVTLGFEQKWTLDLNQFALTGANDGTAFLKSGVWGDVPVSTGLNFTVGPEPDSQDKFSQVLRINYPRGTYRSPGNKLVSNGTVIGGAQFYARPFGKDVASLRALLEYDIFFPANFPFNLGGKLPGFYGAPQGQVASDDCVGGVPANGTNCWSSRYMWRSFGAGEV